ncbi:MAG: ATP-dependent helicase, partial [bacterium]|nr:ATP-dependent helicase [bacterium]
TAKLVHEALEAANIDHQLIGYKQDLYSQSVVRTLLEALRTIAEPDNNISLHHTLTSRLFNIDNSLIAPYAAKARYEHDKLEDCLNSGDNSDDFKDALHLINELRLQSAEMSVGRLLYNLINTTGFKDKLFKSAEQDPFTAQEVQHISQLMQGMKAFESIANQPTLLRYLESLPALMAAGETTDDGTEQISIDTVNVLTVHKAKGLEWDTVYLPDCTEGSFPLRKSGSGIKLPEELTQAITSEADDHYAEERRLMYVALTRARKSLKISFSDRHKSSTVRKPSRFLTEIFGESLSELPAESGSNQTQVSLSFAENDLPQTPEIPKSILSDDKIRLSVSQAATLLNCPKDFYYKFILEAPEDPTPNTAYGINVHNIIESINCAKLSGESVKLDELLLQLEQSWNKSGYSSKQQQQRAYEQAKATIKSYLVKSSAPNFKPLLVEEPFEALLEPESIYLRGRYDLVLQNDNGVEIRDFKTSISVTSPAKAKSRATASIQLTMYALVWQLAHGELPQTVSLDFVDTGQVGYVKKTQRGIDGLRKRLAEAANLIRKNEFPLGNKHDYCIHP